MLKVLTPLASLVVLTALACTRVFCTLIGAESGVTFHLGDVLTDRPATVRVCVDARCVTRQAKTGRWEMIFVPDATLTGTRGSQRSRHGRSGGRSDAGE